MYHSVSAFGSSMGTVMRLSFEAAVFVYCCAEKGVAC
jgi:hypothetical protein